MFYILNKTENNLNEAYLVCDDKGNKKYLTYYELSRLHDVCDLSIEKYKEQDCIISCYMYDDIGKTNAIQYLKSAIDVDNFHNIFNDNWIKYNYSVPFNPKCVF